MILEKELYVETFLNYSNCFIRASSIRTMSVVEHTSSIHKRNTYNQYYNVGTPDVCIIRVFQKRYLPIEVYTRKSTGKGVCILYVENYAIGGFYVFYGEFRDGVVNEIRWV